jgi:hypothetical protein
VGSTDMWNSAGSGLLTASIGVAEVTAPGLKEGGMVIVVFLMPGEAASPLKLERKTESAIDELSKGYAVLCTGSTTEAVGKQSFRREAG